MLDKLTPNSETGASARQKLNAAIDDVNEYARRGGPVSTKADLIGLIEPKNYEIRLETTSGNEYIFYEGVTGTQWASSSNDGTGEWRPIVKRGVTADLTTLAALGPADFEIMKTESTGDEYVFTAGGTVGDIAAADGSGYWIKQSKGGLRRSPVVDSVALRALIPADFELRQVLGNASANPVTEDMEYVFKLGAVSGDIRDNGMTGYWIKQELPAKNLRGIPVNDEAELTALVPDDYEIRQILADSTDPLSVNTEYVFDALATSGDIAPTTGTGFWIKQEIKTMLRGPRVQDEAELTALSPHDYELRQVLADPAVPTSKDTEYVFSIGATTGDIASDDGTGYWIKQNPKLGLRGERVANSFDLTALVPSDYELREIQGDATAIPPRAAAEYVFELGATSGDIRDINQTGYWIKQELEPSLRGARVQDITELIALVPFDYEIREVKGDLTANPIIEAVEYVFELGATSGTYQDAGSTGYWIKQEAVAGLRGSPVQDSTELTALVPHDYELRQILADPSDPLSVDVDYIFKLNAQAGTFPDDAGKGYWIKQEAVPGLRGSPVQDENELTALFPSDYEIRQIKADPNDPLSVDTDYIFSTSATAGPYHDPLNTGYWIKQESSTGLRGSPVQNSVELAALNSADYELRQILADPTDPTSVDVDYIFKLGATSGAYPNNNHTGYWIKQESSTGLRGSPVQNSVELTALTPSDYELRQILADSNDPLSVDTDYVFKLGSQSGAYSDNGGTGKWIKQEEKSGLRGAPVQDINVLKNLVATNFELRKVLGDATAVPPREAAQYVFDITVTAGTSTSSDVADTAGTGYWVKQISEKNLRGTPIDNIIDLGNLIASDFEIRQVKADINDPLSVDTDYVFKFGATVGDVQDAAGTGYWIKHVSIAAPGLRGPRVQDAIELVALVPSDYELREVIDEDTEYVFSTTATSGAYQDAGLTGYWIKQEPSSGLSLRGPRVQDAIELVALTPSDYELREVIDEDTEYVFSTTATSGAYQDAGLTGYWIKQETSQGSGLRGSPVQDAIELVALVPSDYELRQILADPTDPLSEDEDYIFKLGAGAGAYQDAGLTGYWIKQEKTQGSGLRGTPVQDVAELTALVPANFEIRQILTDPTDPLSEDTEYVFKLGASVGTYPNNSHTGYWIKQDKGLRGTPVQDAAELTALVPSDFELRQILADPSDPLSVDINYVFKLGASTGDLHDNGSTGWWIKQESTEAAPGLRGAPVQTAGELIALVPKDFELRQILADPSDPLSIDTDYVFKFGATVGAYQDVGGNGRWIKQDAGSGLRGSPVQDSAELIALIPEDFELRQILADPTDPLSVDVDYIFKFGATVGTYQDAGLTGYWIKQEPGSGLRGSPVQDSTELIALIPEDFELRQILAVPGDPLSIDTDYVFKFGATAGAYEDAGGKGYWIKQDPGSGLRGSPVQDATELIALIPEDFELRQILAVPGDPLSMDTDYVFKFGATAGAYRDADGKGWWIKQEVGTGLRKSPVDTTIELQALVPSDFELRQVKADPAVIGDQDFEYVFKYGMTASDVTVDDLPDNGGTGYWIKQIEYPSYRVDYQRLAADTTNIVTPFRLENVLVFRNGLLQSPETYAIAANNISIDTLGDKEKTEFITVETTGCDSGMRTRYETIVLDKHLFDFPIDLGANPLIFVDGLLLMDDEWTRVTPSAIDFGLGNELIEKQRFVIVY